MRNLLIGSGALLLVFVAAWLFLRDPATTPLPRPVVADAPPDEERQPEVPVQVGISTQPEFEAPGPVEPVPAADDAAGNATGNAATKVTLRLVDADREVPMALTTFAMSSAHVWLDRNGKVSESKLVAACTPELFVNPEQRAFFLTESTDGGLIELQVTPPGDQPGSQFLRIQWTPVRFSWRLPTPDGMEPAFTMPELGQEIADAITEHRATPIDVRWRRAPSVSATVRSADGQPVAGAAVIAIAKSTPQELVDWGEVANTFLGQLRSAPDPARALQTLLDEFGKSVTTRETGALAPRFDAGNLPARRSDENGRADCIRLFRGEWIFCVLHPRFEPTFETLQLEARDYQPTFVLNPNGLASLRVIAEVEDGDVRTPRVGIYVKIGGPWGAPWHWLQHSSWREPPGNTLELHGLEPATYEVSVLTMSEQVELERGAATSIVVLKPGESREVVLRVGSAHMASWLPVVHADTTPCKSVSLRLQGGPYPRGISLHFGIEDPTPLRLPPGEYTAEIAGLEPFKFTLEPGQARSDEFQIPLYTASVELSAEVLAAWGNQEFARLSLTPAGQVPMDEETLSAANDASHLGLCLEPGATRHLRLAAGAYNWRLSAGLENEIEGLLTVASTGANHFHFTAESMPGAARLDVDATAFITAGQKVPALQLSGAGVRGNAIGTWHSSRWGQLRWNHEPDLLARLNTTPGKVRLFAAPGRWLLRVGEVPMLVTIPGNITLTPTGQQPDANFRWTSTLEGVEHAVEVIDSGGLSKVVPKNNGAPVLSGPLRIRAHRYSGGGDSHSATLSMVIGRGPLELNLDELEWQAFGSFTIECEGRGSPEATRDAWWMLADPEEIALVVESLDHADAAGAPILRPEIDPKWHPGSRLAFRFLESRAPAGRYRVVPWPGAPDRYCVTFEVKPGENTEVVVKGG